MRRYALAIEWSNPSALDDASRLEAGVALGELVAGGEPRLVDREAVDSDLMVSIERLCARTGVRAQDLARVAVSIGPGGFTSVRIGVSIAKAICEAGGAACVGVPTAQVVAHGAGPLDASFAVALASKRGTAHMTVFAPTGEVVQGGRIVHADEIERLGVSYLIGDRHLDPAIRARCDDLAIKVLDARFDAGSLLALSERIEAVDPASLVPIYPREPEAVTRWRARGSGRSPDQG